MKIIYTIVKELNNVKTQKERRMALNMTEVARLLLGLRAAGWDEKKINDFILYIETGEEKYKPKPDNQ